MEFERRSVQCASPSGLHRLSYLDWGDRSNPRVVVCVHGLTRSARDFDTLARNLSRDCRVICPDLPGRGDSQWLKNPLEYTVPVYVSAMVTLIARLDVGQVDWVGTSLGGMVGMGLASLAENPIRRLVLNDVGPVVSALSLQRIAEYVGKAPAFSSFETAEAYMRTVSASFGPHSDEQWRALTQSMVRRSGEGWKLHYDPSISLAFKAQATGKDIEFWPIYEAIGCPTLVIRGAESDLLTPETAAAMVARGPKARLVELPGIGHAPTLMQDDQVALVREFLS